MILLDRKKAPSVQEVPIIPILKPKESIFSNGIRLANLSGDTFGTIKFEISFPRDYRQTNYAIAYLASRMLQEGTSEYSSQEISDIIASNGSFLDISVSNDFITIELYCLRPFFKELIELIYSIVYDPIFPESEFVNLKNRYIQQFKNNIEKTSYLASIYSKEMLFGSNHPYVSNTRVDGIEAVTIDLVKEYYQTSICGIQPELFLTGDITENEINEVELIFGSISVKSIDQSISIMDQKANGFKFIEKEKSVQNTLAICSKSILRNHKDFHRLIVTNEILGGFFGSRLMKNIREDKGYTYGIYSRVISLKHDSYLYIGADLKPEYIDPCIQEIKKEVKILKSEKIQEEELHVVKNYLLGHFAGSLNSVFDHMKKRKSIIRMGLSHNYYEEYLKVVKEITSDDIIETATEYLNEDKFLTLNIGTSIS